ncbi:hypothetical protein M8C21_003013 [Ambrosia artemisiifolia]|uniref:Gnk2-homologous domain-containing protein n=1 Tax=Ambrosia artemisiifolia TaxID=4212 RepID=A0AAD5GLZ0_AMBAR|nr:hypothetical protein M8C21_003013 [Ambrosia artemisiifolia]
MSKGGEIQLEGCFVKYDYTSFFGAEDKTEICRNCGPSIGYNFDVLNRIDSALAYLVSGNAQYFRGGEFGSIQGVAQCVQDLSLSDCQDCLTEANGRLRSECPTSTWGDMYLGKCYIRYADQGNLNLDNNNNNGDKRRGKGGKIKKSVLIWSIVGSILFSGGATIALFCAYGNCFNIKEYKKKLKKLKFDKKVAEKERDTAKTETKTAEKERDSAKTETKTTKEKAQKLEKERDSAKTEAKAAKEKADKLEKEIQEQLKKCVPFVPPFPPPCPYPPMLPMPPPCSYLPMPPPCPYLLK